MTIYIDIDETICHSPDAPQYFTSFPIEEAIKKANSLYDEGHTIIYWTARGSSTGIDWTVLTTEQLKKWGVKYHELKFNKPNYDIFIDDKNVNSNSWNNEEILQLNKKNKI
jgi:hypothetical protein